MLLLLNFRLALSLVHIRLDDARQLYSWRKSLSLITIGLGTLALGWLWLPVLQSWAAFLGLVSAGIARLCRVFENERTGLQDNLTQQVLQLCADRLAQLVTANIELAILAVYNLEAEWYK